MFGDLYRMNLDRVLSLVADQDPEQRVPACPAWTALDVVRHLTGLATDVVHLEVDGYASAAWTDRQVADRQRAGFEELAAEWRDSSEDLAAMIDDIEASDLPDVIMTATGPQKRRGFAAAIVGDLLHHEFDLRHAFGDRSNRDRPDVVMFGIGHAKALRPVYTHLGLPTLRIVIEGSGEHVDVGREEPLATLTIEPFEALRTIGGRRTRSEIEELRWSGDFTGFLDHVVLPTMSAPVTTLGER